AEIESRRIYAELGYGSLFEFAVKELRYSEAAADRRIQAMRFMKDVPVVEEKVCTGEVNVTTLALAQRATRECSPEEKKEVLDLLEEKSQKEAEVILAERFPEIISLKEKERVVSRDLTQITFMADRELMEKLEKLKHLLSHQNPHPSYQELFHLLADQLLKRIDPERRAKRDVTERRVKRDDTEQRD